MISQTESRMISQLSCFSRFPGIRGFQYTKPPSIKKYKIFHKGKLEFRSLNRPIPKENYNVYNLYLHNHFLLCPIH